MSINITDFVHDFQYCGICKSELCDKENILIISCCDKLFHKDCIKKVNKCPYCRDKLYRLKKIRGIYLEIYKQITFTYDENKILCGYCDQYVIESELINHQVNLCPLMEIYCPCCEVLNMRKDFKYDLHGKNICI